MSLGKVVSIIQPLIWQPHQVLGISAVELDWGSEARGKVARLCFKVTAHPGLRLLFALLFTWLYTGPLYK